MTENNPNYLKDLDELEDIEFEREKAAPINLRSIRLIDMTKFREGTAVRLIPVKPENQNHDLCWRVEYIPDQGMFDSITGYIKLFTGMGSITSISDEKFPDSAVHADVKLDWDGDGVPEDCVLLLENDEGEAPLRDMVIGKIDESISELEEKKGEAEGEKLAEKAKNLANQGGKRAATQKESPNKNRNRNRDRDKSKRRKRGKSRSRKKR